MRAGRGTCCSTGGMEQPQEGEELMEQHGKGCAGWDPRLGSGELGWENKAGREGEKYGRVLTKKGKTEGRKKTSLGSKWAKGCERGGNGRPLGRGNRSWV